MDHTKALPDHILCRIFKQQSFNMIKTCSLVCRRWNKIIGDSPIIMEKFKLNLDKPEDKILSATELERKHQTAIIRNISESLDVIIRHKLQSLIIYNCDNTSKKLLIKALRKLDELKVLLINSMKFVDDLDSHDRTVNVNLNHLMCPVDIIELFYCNTLKKLTLIWEEDVTHAKKMSIVGFYDLQTNLESLVLYGNHSGDFFSIPDIMQQKLFLNRLRLNCFYHSFIFYEAFIKFLELHKNTLTSLELNIHTSPHIGIQVIHKYALENLTKLKHFESGYILYDDMDLWEIFGAEISFENLQSTAITQNIDSLSIRARSVDMEDNKRYFSMFPNLKHLRFEGIDNKDFIMLSHIAEINNKLETLELLTLDQSEHSAVYFPNLKEFTMNGISQDNISDFIDRHSKTLEKIIFNWTYEFDEVIVQSFLNCRNLKHLELRPKGELRKELFIPFSLRTEPFTLVILKRAEAKLTYCFPDDKAVWDQRVLIEFDG